MCEPITLTTALLIASTTIAAAGTAVSAISQSNQAKYQSQVQAQNAKLADNAAADALARGRIDAATQYRKNAAIKGEQVAAQAANGIDVTFGNAVDLAGDTASFGQQDAMTVRENARRESIGFSISSANYASSAAASRSAAGGALVSGAFNIGSTILGGAAQVANASSPRYNSPSAGASLATYGVPVGRTGPI